MLPPAALLIRLERRLPLLTGGARDAPARHQTLRATIDWSHDQITSGEQVLFRRLAVFAGGFTLEAAEGIAGDGEDVLDGITSLVEKHLLRPEDGTDGEPRFGMLETIREFAAERLQASGEADALAARHAAYFLALAERALPTFFTPAELAWFDRLDAERPNLRAALSWAAERGETEVLLRLAVALWWYWWHGASITEGSGWLERAASATAQTPAASRGTRAILLAAATRAVAWQGEVTRAAALIDESLALARDAEDATAIARAIQEMGRLAIVQADLDRAEDLVTEALRRWRELAEPVWIVDALFLLGWITSLRGDQERAEGLFVEVLVGARALGSEALEALALEALGTCANERGDRRRAATLVGESLTILRNRTDLITVANCLKNLGVVAAAGGEAEQGARLLGAAEWLRERHGYDPPPVERKRIDRAAALTRARLPEDVFATAWTAGRALPLDQAIAEALAVADASAAEPAARPGGLSPREQQVLSLIAAGHTDREIAAALAISRRTATTHLTHILDKLGLDSRTAAAAYAVRHGLA